MTDTQENADNIVNLETPAAEPSPDATAVLAAEVASLKDQLLRAMAETENTRKRAQKEREDAAKYGTAMLAKGLLGVADNLRRALDAAVALEGEAAKNFLKGVEATERQLLAAFEAAGIKKMEPMGQPFDPNLHQVMVEIEMPDKAPGTVVQVMQAGYTIHDRLLREALVGVAKGGAPMTKKVDEKA
jgi:molecular chaperone GrpE